MKPWKCTLRFLRTATLSQNRSINMVLPDPTAEQQGYRGRGCGGGVSGCREAGLAVPPTYRTPQVNAFDFSLHRGASPENLMGGGGGAWSVHELVLYVTMPSSPPPPPLPPSPHTYSCHQGRPRGLVPLQRVQEFLQSAHHSPLVGVVTEGSRGDKLVIFRNQFSLGVRQGPVVILKWG